MKITLPEQVPELVIAGRIATITLRRPDVANRLELEDLNLLLTQLEQVNAKPEVLVLRLVAQGRHFCSGFNIGKLENGAREAGQLFEQLASLIEQARPVTIAAIQGGVFGGGTDLALACDFRLGTPACEMSVPAARLGLLFYRGGLERYVTRLGLATSKRILLAADKLTAEDMLNCGYLDRVAPSVDALPDLLEALSLSLANMAPLALLGMKKHLNRIAGGTLDAAEIARDIALVDISDDLREGALAWQQKRTPIFSGH